MKTFKEFMDETYDFTAHIPFQTVVYSHMEGVIKYVDEVLVPNVLKFRTPETTVSFEISDEEMKPIQDRGSSLPSINENSVFYKPWIRFKNSDRYKALLFDPTLVNQPIDIVDRILYSAFIGGYHAGTMKAYDDIDEVISCRRSRPS